MMRSQAAVGLRVLAADEARPQAVVAPLRPQEPCAVAERRIGRHVEPHGGLLQGRNRVQRTPVRRRVGLLAADHAVGARAGELGDELLVVAAIGRVPVDPPKLGREAADRRDIEPEQRACSDVRAELRVRLRRDDVAERNRRLVELAIFELTEGGERSDAGEPNRESFAANDDLPRVPADELERPGHEAWRSADDGERIREAPPRPGKLDRQRRSRWRGDSCVGEEPARRRIRQTLDPT